VRGRTQMVPGAAGPARRPPQVADPGYPTRRLGADGPTQPRGLGTQPAKLTVEIAGWVPVAARRPEGCLRGRSAEGFWITTLMDLPAGKPC
jgi:hypothetical protein